MTQMALTVDILTFLQICCLHCESQCEVQDSIIVLTKIVNFPRMMLARLKMHEVYWCVTFPRPFSTILTKKIPIPPHFFLVDTKKMLKNNCELAQLRFFEIFVKMRLGH